MYEGRAPRATADVLLRDFDDEMERYGAVLSDPSNPVTRLRIITSTRAAADYLGARARRMLGPGIDLDVRHTDPAGG